MSTELTQAIRDGLDDPNPLRSVERIKRAVERGIREADPTADVKPTEYFNHTFAPDLILEWKRDGEKRPVYLRFNDNLAYLAEDMDLVGDQHALFLGLDTMPDDASGVASVSSIARRSGSLVTDPDSLWTLGSERRQGSGVAGLFASSIVQGGRGVIDEVEIGRTARVVAKGFTAARALDVAATREAASLVSELLLPSQAERLGGLIHVLWVGSGGREEDYPGTGDLHGGLTDTALRFLLETKEVAEDPGFWWRIGQTVDIDQIGRLPLEGYVANLQHLVRANLDRLMGKIMCVRADGGQISLDGELRGETRPLFWTVDRGIFSLQGPNFQAWIASQSKELDGVAGGDVDRPTVETVLRRAKNFAAKIDEMELWGDDRSVVYRSRHKNDITIGDGLNAAAEAVGERQEVHKAVAVMRSGRHIYVDFTKATASAGSNARLPLQELVTAGTNLLCDLLESARRDLSAIFPIEDYSPDLFSDL